MPLPHASTIPLGAGRAGNMNPPLEMPESSFQGSALDQLRSMPDSGFQGSVMDQLRSGADPMDWMTESFSDAESDTSEVSFGDPSVQILESTTSPFAPVIGLLQSILDEHPLEPVDIFESRLPFAERQIPSEEDSTPTRLKWCIDYLKQQNIARTAHNEVNRILQSKLDRSGMDESMKRWVESYSDADNRRRRSIRRRLSPMRRSSGSRLSVDSIKSRSASEAMLVRRLSATMGNPSRGMAMDIDFSQSADPSLFSALRQRRRMSQITEEDEVSWSQVRSNRQSQDAVLPRSLRSPNSPRSPRSPRSPGLPHEQPSAATSESTLELLALTPRMTTTEPRSSQPSSQPSSPHLLHTESSGRNSDPAIFTFRRGNEDGATRERHNSIDAKSGTGIVLAREVITSARASMATTLSTGTAVSTEAVSPSNTSMVVPTANDRTQSGSPRTSPLLMRGQTVDDGSKAPLTSQSSEKTLIENGVAEANGEGAAPASNIGSNRGSLRQLRPSIALTHTNSTDEDDMLRVARKSSSLPPNIPAMASDLSVTRSLATRPMRLQGNTTRVVRSFSTRSSRAVLENPLVDFDDKCLDFLDGIRDWGLDIFKFESVAAHRPLVGIAMQVLSERNLFDNLGLDKSTAARFFARLEDGYGRYPDVLYHNNLHAADVTHSTFLLMEAPIVRNCLNDLEVLAAVIAAAGHDVGHFGFNNTFLAATSAPLAILYNDQSILENHHAATSFKLMQEEGCNLLANLEADLRTTARSLVIDMILATDMAKHFTFLAEFRSFVERINNTSCRDLTDLSDEDRQLLLQAIVHCADLAGPTKPFAISKVWAERIVNELFRQGDRERELQLEVGPINDRDKTNLPTSQIGFIDFIVMPLWTTWYELVGEEPDQSPIENITANRATWQELKDKDERTSPLARRRTGRRRPKRLKSASHRSGSRAQSAEDPDLDASTSFSQRESYIDDASQRASVISDLEDNVTGEVVREVATEVAATLTSKTGPATPAHARRVLNTDQAKSTPSSPYGDSTSVSVV